MVRYGGGSHKQLVDFEFFAFKQSPWVHYGGGQRKRLDGCFQTESTVRYGGGQRKLLSGFEFFAFKQSPQSATAVVNANG